jgi:hypothetical protein
MKRYGVRPDGGGHRHAGRTAPATGSGWRRIDRIFVGLCWASGVTLCLIAGSLVLFMLFKGFST